MHVINITYQIEFNWAVYEATWSKVLYTDPNHRKEWLLNIYLMKAEDISKPFRVVLNNKPVKVIEPTLLRTYRILCHELESQGLYDKETFTVGGVPYASMELHPPLFNNTD